MKLLVNLAKADPIGPHGVDTQLTLAVGAEFERAYDRVREGHIGL
jgi:hypothetical protein